MVSPPEILISNSGRIGQFGRTKWSARAEFTHSKIFVSDDQIATVGTTNLDFRSFYLHFECGVWMYNSKAVLQIKKDYFDTLNECTQITLEECIERLPIRVFQEILRIFAPLM